MRHKRLRCGNVVFRIGIGGFEKEVSGCDASAAAGALPRRLPNRTRPAGEDISRSCSVAAMMQRVMQRIVDELGELLREGLHVSVFHYRGRVAKIRTEHEGVSGA